MCSCHSIPECCVIFSGVKLSMGSFVLFIIEKLFVSAIDFNSKSEDLLTSARVIAIELYKEYDIIVMSFKFIRIQISSVNVHH